jgi:hypothetical protein
MIITAGKCRKIHGIMRILCLYGTVGPAVIETIDLQDLQDLQDLHDNSFAVRTISLNLQQFMRE